MVGVPHEAQPPDANPPNTHTHPLTHPPTPIHTSIQATHKAANKAELAKLMLKYPEGLKVLEVKDSYKGVADDLTVRPLCRLPPCLGCGPSRCGRQESGEVDGGEQACSQPGAWMWGRLGLVSVAASGRAWCSTRGRWGRGNNRHLFIAGSKHQHPTAHPSTLDQARASKHVCIIALESSKHFGVILAGIIGKY